MENESDARKVNDPEQKHQEGSTLQFSPVCGKITGMGWCHKAGDQIKTERASQKKPISESIKCVQFSFHLEPDAFNDDLIMTSPQLMLHWHIGPTIRSACTTTARSHAPRPKKKHKLMSGGNIVIVAGKHVTSYAGKHNVQYIYIRDHRELQSKTKQARRPANHM